MSERHRPQTVSLRRFRFFIEAMLRAHSTHTSRITTARLVSHSSLRPYSQADITPTKRGWLKLSCPASPSCGHAWKNICSG